MSSGTLVLGLLNGLQIGLLAVGFVLVYKSNRFLNLAHAQLGTLSALLIAKWVIDDGWSFWAAFALAIVIGIATGLLVERFFVGRLRARTSSPITLLLLSLGISQLLLAITYIPRLSPDPGSGREYPQPFAGRTSVGGVLLSGMSWLTLALVPVLVVGLAAFMRYSIMGKQIRAAANNPDAARLCGVPVRKVSAVTWAIAGGFSAVSAVLQAPNQASFNVASLGPSLLLLTVGAAAFGAFVSLPGALIGGLVLGMVNQVVAGITSSGADAQLSVFVVTLLIVLVRGKAIGKVFELAGAVAESRSAVRIPESLKHSAIVRYQPAALAGGALLVALLLPQMPYFSSEGHRFLLTLVLIAALLGIGLTMLLGWAGQVSLGHFGVVGITAYLTARWSSHGLSLPALMVLAAVIGGVVLVIVGIPALRVRGLTLAVTTLGLSVLTTDYLLHKPWLAGPDTYGASLTPPSFVRGLGTPSSQGALYYVALAVLVLGLACAQALRRSMPGRLVIAVRDNEKASAAFGVSSATIKLSILAVSGGFAGVAGVLWAEAWRTVTPSQFSADVSIALIAIPVIGGLGSLAGAVLAAVMVYGFTYFLGPVVTPIFGDYGRNLGFTLFLAGAGQILALLYLRGGLAGMIQGWWQGFLERRAARLALAEVGIDLHLPLKVAGVGVMFGSVLALDGAEIEVRAGEIVGLIGTNGAGKTTLVNVVSGVIAANSGSVRIFGHEVTDLPADFRAAYGLARSFQDASLFAGLTVAEILQVAASQRSRVGFLSAMLRAPWVRASERRTREEAVAIAERFGLLPWIDAPASELSTGTRRICDLAAQVASKPRLLVLDEPTAGVAQREAEAFGPLLRQIRDELDCAILIVEHDMPLLMKLCDRVYAMEAGQVVAEGTPEEIRNNPRVIAGYLGTDAAAIERSGSIKTRTTRAKAPSAKAPPAKIVPTKTPRARAPQSPKRATS